MKIIKIIGYGEVVKYFLASSKKNFPNILFIIYCRSLPANITTNKNIIFSKIDTYQQDEHPTFFCCSINEAQELKKAKTSSRLTVAISNLKLIHTFIQTGFFNHGLHFILTNPSELLAEYVIRKTNNKNIFALGLSVDLQRYQSILPQFNINPINAKFNVIGNHWNYPLLNFEDNFLNNNISLLENLMRALKNKIQNEFQGFKPPIKSGAIALYEAIVSLNKRKNFSASGFLEEFDIVGGGILNIEPFKFTHPKINAIAKTLLVKIINTHKETYNNLIKEIL